MTKMDSEKAAFEQAVPKLFGSNSSNNARLNNMETKLAEIHDNLVDQSRNATNLPQEIINLEEK